MDDVYNKLRRDIGNDFQGKKEGKIVELYLFHCGNCGYRNMHAVNATLDNIKERGIPYPTSLRSLLTAVWNKGISLVRLRPFETISVLYLTST
jgi:hypothetical protein